MLDGLYVDFMAWHFRSSFVLRHDAVVVVSGYSDCSALLVKVGDSLLGSCLIGTAQVATLRVRFTFPQMDSRKANKEAYGKFFCYVFPVAINVQCGKV